MLKFMQDIIDEANKKAFEKENKINEFVKSLDDEIANKTSFKPLKTWWANFKTHHLVIDNFWNIIFKPKLWFPLIFILGFSLPLIFSIMDWVSKISKWWNIIENPYEILNIFSWEFIFSLIIVIPIYLMIHFAFRSKIFDFQNWYFYDLSYKNKLFELLNNEKYKNKIIPINQIYALQIISETVSLKNSNYLSYELNMVLKDWNRINVVDYWDVESIKKDSKEIANRLWIKIWDLTNL